MRLTITITIGPTDKPRIEILKWVIDWLIALHHSAPAPIRATIEPDEPGADIRR